MQELDQVMSERPVPAADDLPKLQYLDMVLSEVHLVSGPQCAHNYNLINSLLYVNNNKIELINQKMKRKIKHH